MSSSQALSKVIGYNCTMTVEAQKVKGRAVLLNGFWVFPLHSVTLLNSSS